MKRSLLIVLVLLLSISLFGCVSEKNQTPVPTPVPAPTPAPPQKEEPTSTVYKNAEYGFSFTLPESWKDYSIVNDKWEGLSVGGAQGEAIVESGPMILIRHPEWTASNPRQDIPIMIFTVNQWNLLQQDKFHIGAAPIGPSELGRNDQYVFALPARYNFAYPTGYEEVEDILKSNPLQTNK